MRKSAILGQSGRRNFVSPVLSNATSSPATPPCSSSREGHDAENQTTQGTKRSISDVIRLLNGAESEPKRRPVNCHSKNEAPVTKETKEKVYASPFTSKLCNTEISSENSSVSSPVPPKELSSDVRYFSVLWCKQSTKKHKRWEGDAILIIKGRSATLKSLEGKEMGTAFGYTLAEMSAVEVGSTFKLAGKECEIQDVIPAEEYLSGRCFISGTVPDDSSCSAVSSKATVVPFRTPQIGGHPGNARRFIPPNVPLITADSLVLPRPGDTPQCKNGLPITDVVVEASLARHLRPHQKEGVVFLYECIMNLRPFCGSGAILADEMGLGKTLQCIALIWTLLRQGPYGGKPCLRQVLIITPSSLVKNWVKEFKKWLVNRNLRVYHVDQNNKIDVFLRQPSLYPVLILSYEMYVRCRESLSGVSFDLLVCDEAHRLKNANIKTTGCLQNVGTDKKILLTGTPVQNDLQEFYALIDFCNPGILGTQSSFRRVYEEPIVHSRRPTATAEEKELGEARTEELAHLTSLFILRRTQEVIKSYLPGKVEYVVFCRPRPLQLRLYSALLGSNAVRSCLTSYLSCDATCHLSCILALRKLCNHPLLIYEPEVTPCDDQLSESLLTETRSLFPSDFAKTLSPLEDSSGKMRVLARLLSSLCSTTPLQKIVIVSSFTKTLDLLQELCSSKGYPFLRLDGSTSSAQRMQLVDRFNSSFSDCFVFLLSSKAGGVGLNLVGANRIVLYDVDWNPANDLQAMARIWRDGQSKDVSIYRLLTTGTIEEKIFQRQVAKQDLSGTVLETRKDSQKAKFSIQDLKDLFSLDERTVSSTHDLLRCPCRQENDTALENLDFDFEDDFKDDDEKKHSSVQPWQPRTASADANLSEKVGMDDLRNWEHIAAPITALQTEDLHLASASDDITFVFKNVVYKSAASVRPTEASPASAPVSN